MSLKNKLPVSYLLFTTRGRIGRGTYWVASIFIWSTFYILYKLIGNAFPTLFSVIVYPLLFWSMFATAAKRLHDTNKRATWLLLLLIPVLGPVFIIYLLGFRKGKPVANRFGAVPDSAPDYFRNPDAAAIPHLGSNERIVNDVTQINPVLVSHVAAPASIDELRELVVNADRPISIGGGRFSMGGQTASSYSLHIDMRRLNRILECAPEHKTIKVQAGARWCDIQKYVDSLGLSVQIMQTYANFTVGGSLSVNCHGRYVGLGPVILSVQSLEVMLADGSLIHCSPDANTGLFYACVGCYNAVAIIVSAELSLADNVCVQRSSKKMLRTDYAEYFNTVIKGSGAVFHNGDIYPPSYKRVRAVSWNKTTAKPTVPVRMMPLAAAYPVERYFIGAFAKSNFGKWRREFIIDPLLYMAKKVHWRNYEAGYDVLELEPDTRKDKTYVLQEYFVGEDKFDAFTDLMSEIFKRHKVNVINVSIRHAKADSGSLLAWARGDVFAFVVWYRQYTNDIEKNKVAVWTRELIDAALSLEGSYYLPYQAHATVEQFHKAYPRAKQLFKLKQRLDPDFKFRHVLWNKYYKQEQNDVRI